MQNRPSESIIHVAKVDDFRLCHDRRDKIVQAGEHINITCLAMQVEEGHFKHRIRNRLNISKRDALRDD